MTRFITTAKRTILTSFLLLFAIMPASTAVTFADECTPPPSDAAGVHWPTGADAGTFTYQCDGAYNGQWTNDYYVYNPSTQQRTPRYDVDYQFNCSTGVWTMLKWYYSPAADSFFSTRITTANPGLDTDCPVAPAAGGSGGGSGPSQSISNTGPNSQNSANSNTTVNGTNTNNNNLTMNNGILSLANSGNAGISGNTTGGSAASGDATSITNVANMLQSSSNVFGPDTLTFTADINGDVNGDFIFDPSAVLSDTGPDSNNAANNNLTVNTNNTNNTNAQINNTINAGANSGNAAVSNNTSGGDATSGNAHAIVNLMNVINSTIVSGKSFVGTININGNLNGDILLPPELINQLLASTGPNSNNKANNNVTHNSTTTNNTTESIKNNINSSAQTGTADVSNNTSGGTATSGTANTGVTMLNMAGANVSGKKNLLVFVNVLGHWVGMIVDAPAGSTAASLGGGISNTGPNSNNTTNNNVTTNTNTTNNTNLGITNDVNVHAQSGNASVTGNTKGGNATSGNADTAVNILNIEGVNINLDDWFGVLFINVFGNWTGSFGVNTSAGDPLAAPTPAAGGAGVPATFQFVPNPAVVGSTTSAKTSAATSGGASGSSSDGVVLAAQTVKTTAAVTAGDEVSPTQKAFNRMALPIIGATLAILILAVGERNRIFRRHQN